MHTGNRGYFKNRLLRGEKGVNIMKPALTQAREGESSNEDSKKRDEVKKKQKKKQTPPPPQGRVLAVIKKKKKKKPQRTRRLRGERSGRWPKGGESKCMY